MSADRKRALPTIRYPNPSLRVRFLGRPNRYLARVHALGSTEEFEAHVPNPGRMEELLVPGETEGYVVPAVAALRRTHYDLVAVRHQRSLVSVDSRIGNRIVGAGLASGHYTDAGRGRWVPEFTFRGRRLDFALPGQRAARPKALLEVKCSNLRVGRTALFPDAPTERGVHHLRTLEAAAGEGVRCTVLFVVQRAGTVEFAPNDALDPDFGEALRSAADAGVRVGAIDLTVRPNWVRWGRSLPVRLTPLYQRLL